MLVTSIFSFSHYVFYPIEDKFYVLRNVYVVVRKNSFKVDKAKLLLSGIVLTLYHKILDITKLKSFADDKLIVAKVTISLFHRVKNTMGKVENTSNQHSLLFPPVFSKASFFRVIKSREHVVKI